MHLFGVTAHDTTHMYGIIKWSKYWKIMQNCKKNDNINNQKSVEGCACASAVNRRLLTQSTEVDQVMKIQCIKDQITLPLVWGILAGFFVPHEIES